MDCVVNCSWGDCAGRLIYWKGYVGRLLSMCDSYWRDPCADQGKVSNEILCGCV